MSTLITLQNLLDFVSIIIIVMCGIQKIPQITNLVKMKSTQNLSLLSLFLELTSYTVMTSYNYVSGYSALSYLEYPVILFQQYILIYLVMKYKKAIDQRTTLITFMYFIIFLLMLKQFVPKSFLTFMAPLCTPISASAKVAQLFAILKARNSDSISVTTWFISAMSNLIRILTVWMDSADKIILTNLGISVLLSSSVMCSAMYFKSRPKKEE